MPSRSAPPDPLETALREERELVLALGGFAMELPGGVLVLDERVPVPRFNYVQYVRLNPKRQSAFFERALDQYFQRALRPTFQVEVPVPGFVDRGLRKLGFVPGPAERALLYWEASMPARAAPTPYVVRPAGSEELAWAAGFWAGEAESAELVRALAVAFDHPNPEERLVVYVARRGDRPVAAALLHRYRTAVGIHGVATQPSERGQGAATALVEALLRTEGIETAAPVVIWSESPRLERHLTAMGFVPSTRFALYRLPGDAQLSLPPVGPPAPPRWRPPRRASPTG